MRKLLSAAVGLAFAGVAAAMVPGAPLGLAGPALAQQPGEMSCDQLWYERNAIYAGSGYCFKSDRAIAVFGPRCYPPYGRLTPPEQNRVAQLQRWERIRNCAVAAPAPPAPPAPGGGYAAMSCDELWYARNAIYAAKGYCFKSARAQAAFGAACFPPYGKLTPGEQAQVDAIRQWEGAKGCR